MDGRIEFLEALRKRSDPLIADVSLYEGVRAKTGADMIATTLSGIHSTRKIERMIFPISI